MVSLTDASIQAQWIIHDKEAEIMTIHVKEAEIMTIHVKEAETMNIHVKEAEVMNIHPKEAEIMNIHVREAEIMSFHQIQCIPFRITTPGKLATNQMAACKTILGLARCPIHNEHIIIKQNQQVLQHMPSQRFRNVCQV